MAAGGVAAVHPGRVPLVPSVAAAFRAIGLDGASDIWTISIIPTFYVWHLRGLGGQWFVPNGIMWLEFGSVAAAGGIMLFRRFTRPAVA